MTIEELNALLNGSGKDVKHEDNQIDYDKLAEALGSKFDLKKKSDTKPDDDDDEDDVKGKKFDAKNESKQEIKRSDEIKTTAKAIADARDFLGSVDKTIEDNPAHFGSSAKYIIGKLESLTKNDDDIARANEYRKALIDLWIENKTNLDLLPDDQKIELREYEMLSESARREKSVQFWKIIKTGIAIANAQRKAELIKAGKNVQGISNAESRLAAFLRGNKKEEEKE